MDEQYIYLGVQLKTYFFIHTIANPNFEKTISDQIYNMMIQDLWIIDPTENVIIYEINPTDGSIYLTIIQHATKEGGPNTFGKTNIAKMLKVLVAAKRDNTYVIQHNYEKGCLEFFEIKGDVLSSIAIDIPKVSPPISEVRYTLTTKPFQ